MQIALTGQRHGLRWLTIFFCNLCLLLAPLTLLGLTVEVIDTSGRPCSACQILVGAGPFNPFDDNWGKTDAQGRIEFPKAASVYQQPVTIAPAQKPYFTYLNQSGSHLILRIPAAKSPIKIHAGGQFKNWNSPGQSGLISFGIVTPQIRPNEIFSLQVTDLISPDYDFFTLYGQYVGIPSNISLPQQKVRYGIIPINLDKPAFNVPIPLGQPFGLVGLTGILSVSDAINLSTQPRGNIDLSLLNKMQFESQSALNSQALNFDFYGHEMEARDRKLKNCTTGSAFNVPLNFQVIGAALRQDSDTSPYQITDVKLLSDTPQNLLCLASETRKSISVVGLGILPGSETLKGENVSMTAIIEKNVSLTPASSLKFDSFFNIPQIMESNHGKSLRFSKADIPNKTPEASAFYAVLTKSPQTPLWIVMASGPFSKSNAVGFEIPSVPFLENFESLTFGTRNRWEVIWLGVDNKSSPLTPVSDMSLFEVATHASRSSIDF